MLHNTEYAYGVRWLGFPRFNVPRASMLTCQLIGSRHVDRSKQLSATVIVSYGDIIHGIYLSKVKEDDVIWHTIGNRTAM